MIKITINDKEVQKLFKRVTNKADNKEKAMRQVSLMMQRDIKQHFKDESGSDGSRWKNLRPSTWEWKRSEGYTNMLRNSGDLWKRNLPTHNNKQAIVYNDLDYAKSQNYGDSLKHLPARKFMWLSKKALRDISKFMLKYLIKGV